MSQIQAITTEQVQQQVEALSERWSGERAERQRRRELQRADFDELREAGFLRTGVPVEYGGIWETPARSTRLVCEMLRTLARADPSVALVASMHPATALSGRWLLVDDAPEPYAEAWGRQREWRFRHSLDGHFFGTCVSEPGTGGDSSRSKSEVRVTADGEYRLSGRKHFASGTGICSFMATVALAEGQEQPWSFELDMREVAWDGTNGVRVVALWDGHGMPATQSHALEFDDFPAMRVELPPEVTADGAPPTAALWIAVIVGILDVAMSTARSQLAGRRESLSAYQRTEWTQANLEAWLAIQAYEGALRAIETGRNRAFASLAGKETVAELAENALRRLSRVMGGSAYSRAMPYGSWAEDVRALGFLRPPWSLAHEMLYEMTWRQR